MKILQEVRRAGSYVALVETDGEAGALFLLCCHG
jgi:hypothetical protein